MRTARSVSAVALVAAWYVRKLPSTLSATIGNQALVDWVRTLIK